MWFISLKPESKRHLWGSAEGINTLRWPSGDITARNLSDWYKVMRELIWHQPSSRAGEGRSVWTDPVFIEHLFSYRHHPSTSDPVPVLCSPPLAVSLQLLTSSSRRNSPSALLLLAQTLYLKNLQSPNLPTWTLWPPGLHRAGLLCFYTELLSSNIDLISPELASMWL